MKTVQKFEIAAGLATFMFTVVFFCVFVIPIVIFRYENYGLGASTRDVLRSLIFLLVPGHSDNFRSFLLGG